MERRTHTATWRPKPGQPFYYAFWDVCRVCRHLQHYESEKVFVEPRPEPTEGHKPAPRGSSLDLARRRARAAVTAYIGKKRGIDFRMTLSEILGIEARYAVIHLMDEIECQSIIDRIEDMKKPPRGHPAAV